MTVSPTAGIFSATATKSVLMLPTTTIGFCADNAIPPVKTMNAGYEKSGAHATAVSPLRNKINIHARQIFERAGASANSCQTKTPQHAEIMVAPCPMEYETAGPTICACEATKFAIAPVHKSAPPTIPQRCHKPGARQ